MTTEASTALAAAPAAAPAAPAAQPAAPAAPAAPAVATPAAPAAPAAPEVTPESALSNTQSATDKKGKVSWQQTGDPGLDFALGYIGERGIGHDHPAVQMAMKGDFSVLRATLAQMGDKAPGYDAVVALAEKAYQDTVAKFEANEQAAIGAALSVVGTPETWVAIQEWARANADPAEKEEINAMLSGTPRQVKAAVTYLKTLYENANGTTVAMPSAVKPTAGGRSPTAGPAGGAITSAKEYSRLVSELAKKVGPGNLEQSPEYKQLQQRRLMGRRISK